MAKLSITPGATDQTVYVFVPDSASTTGGGKTGIAHNAAGLTCYYVRERGSATQLTLASLASATAAHADGGWFEVDATNMPGVYRLDLSDAILAASSRYAVVYLRGASGMAPTLLEIDLSNQADTTRLSGTTQTARDIGASVLLSSGTGTGQISLSSGAVTAGTVSDKSGYSLATAPPTAAAVASQVRTELTTELARIDAAISTRSTYAGADTSGTTTLLSRLTSGRAGNLDNLDATVSSRLASASYSAPPSASTVASQVRTELTTELSRIDVATSTRLASASYSAPLDAAGVRTAVGLASANLDTQLGDLPTATEVADAVLSRSASSVEGSAGEHTLCTVILATLESAVSGSTWTIRRTDGTTTHATKSVTTSAGADPITGVS
jgi:hypothetical protein